MSSIKDIKKATLSRFFKFLHANNVPCKKGNEVKRGSEILHEIVRDTPRISSFFFNFRVVSRTISCSISESQLHLISFFFQCKWKQNKSCHFICDQWSFAYVRLYCTMWKTNWGGNICLFACRDCLFILPAGAGARAVGTLPPLSTGIWAHVILTMIFTQILSIVDKNFARFFKI